MHLLYITVQKQTWTSNSLLCGLYFSQTSEKAASVTVNSDVAD